MSTQSVLAVGGAIAGFAIAGPAGAQYGFMAGSLVGALVDQPKGPGPGDLSAPQLQQGASLPRVYGRVRVPVNPVWVSSFTATAVDTGGGKGGAPEGSAGYTYSLDMLGTLADGLNVIDYTRVWVNKKLVVTRLDESSDSSLTASDSTDAYETATLFTGAVDQAPWSVYETSVGTANAVAYRHQCTFAIQGLQCGGSKTPPLVEVEVITDGTGSVTPGGRLVGSTQGTGVLPTLPDGVESGDALILYVTHHDSATFTQNNAVAWPQADNQLDSSSTIRQRFFTRIADGSADDSDMGFSLTFDSACWAVVALREVTDAHFPSSLTRSSSGDYNFNADSWLTLDLGSTAKAISGSQFSLVLGFLAGSPSQNTHLTGVPSGYTELANQTLTYTVTGHDVLSQMMVGYRTLVGSSENPGGFSSDLSLTPISLGGMSLLLTYRSSPGGLTPGTIDLKTIVDAELSMNPGINLSDHDTSDLAGVPVNGYKAIGSPSQTISELAEMFYFDCIPGNPIKYVRRGVASVGSIANSDTGIGVDEPAKPFTGLKRLNGDELPAVVGIAAPNLLQDHDIVFERGDRLTSDGPAIVRMETNVVFTPTQVKGRAITATLMQRASANQASFGISDKYAKAEPGDAYTVSDEDGNTYSLLLRRFTYADGVKACDWELNDTTALVETGITDSTYTSSIVVVTLGDTELELMDIPILRDADDSPGFYASLKPASGTAWTQGAKLYESLDGTTYTVDGTAINAATFGTCTTTLGDWTGNTVFDETNTVTVNVGDGTLSSSTRDAILSDPSINAFLIGNEIVNAVTCTLVSTGIYTLSRLLRGRRGTEWAMTGHAASERVVKLGTAGTLRVDRTSSQLGAAYNYKAVTIGQTIASVIADSFTDNGIGLKPFAPVDLRADTSDASQTTITWKRRTRLACRFTGTAGINVPLGEASESYYVELRNGGGTLIDSDTVTDAEWSVSGAVSSMTLDEGVWGLAKVGSSYYGVTVEGPSFGGKYLHKMSSTTGALEATSLYLGEEVAAFIVNGTDLYVAVSSVSNTTPAAYTASNVYRFDASDIYNIAATYNATAAGDAQGLAFDGTYLWLAERYTGQLVKLDASTLASLATYVVTAGISAMVYDTGSLYICDSDSSQIVKWDTTGHSETWRVSCVSNPADIHVENGLVFVIGSSGLGVYATSDGSVVNTIAGLRDRLVPFGAYVLALNGSTPVLINDTTGALDRSLGVQATYLAGADGSIFFVDRSPILHYSNYVGYGYTLIGSLTGYTVTVYQNSATVGHGYSASITL